MYERILAAVGWTSNTEAVLAETRLLARLSGAEVHVLHVDAMGSVIRPSTLGMLVNGALTGDTPHPDGAEGTHRRTMNDSVAGLVAAGIRARGTVLETPPGNAPRAVVEQADDIAADLIVVGIGPSDPPNATSRSTPIEEIIKHARRPVLVVP